jgi:nitrogenase subunit NifH
MQLNDDELDKKLEELEKQRKTLYETASKTNKITEKEKYRKLKEDLKLNQKEVILFTIEKEKRETERKLTKAPSQVKVKYSDYEKQLKQLKKKTQRIT